MQGIQPIHSRSGTSSRRPSVTIASFLPQRDSEISSRHSVSVSVESSVPGTPIVQYPYDLRPNTPPEDPVMLELPPIPDFDKSPFAKPMGPVFEGEWAPFVNRLEDEVVEFLVACETLAQGLNFPIQKLRPLGLHSNILALDEQTILEITRDCWWIMYEIISEQLGWNDILNRKRSLLERLKRNLRQSQPCIRWDVPCDILISLGFTEPWLYEQV